MSRHRKTHGRLGPKRAIRGDQLVRLFSEFNVRAEDEGYATDDSSSAMETSVASRWNTLSPSGVARTSVGSASPLTPATHIPPNVYTFETGTSLQVVDHPFPCLPSMGDLLRALPVYHAAPRRSPPGSLVDRSLNITYNFNARLVPFSSSRLL